MIAEVNGTSLYYEQEGSGADLVLIPGLGASTHVWYAQVKGLSSVLRVTTFDPRGHGRSGRPSGPYSVRQMAEDAAALLRRHAIGPAAVAGSSMSAAVAIELAARHPDLVSSLLLVGGFPSLPPAGKERMAARAKTAEAEGMAAVADMVAAGALGASTHHTQPALVGLFRAVLLANDPHAYAAAARAVVETDVAEAMGKVRCPALILLGSQEQVAPLSTAMALKAGIPHGVVRIIPNAGHLPFLEQPAAFNAAVMEFLAGCE